MNRDAETFVTFVDGSQSLLRRTAIGTIEALSGRARLRRLYDRYLVEKGLPEYRSENFFSAAIRLLEIDVRFDDAALARVPREGPTLFVANHPFGALDGVILI